MKTKNRLFLLLGFSIAMLAQGCSTTPLTPSQTAQHFWSAMLEQDMENATRFATENSLPAIRDSAREFDGASVSFGKVSIASEQATIETTLQYQSRENDQPATFTTFLDREKEYWRVNFVETQRALEKSREKRGLSKIVDDLSTMGRKYSNELNEALKSLEDAGPEIKKDLENLGGSVQKDLQGAIEKIGPEIQRNLQEFSESLDGAMKELQKNLPDQKKPETTPESEPETEPKPRMI